MLLRAVGDMLLDIVVARPSFEALSRLVGIVVRLVVGDLLGPVVGRLVQASFLVDPSSYFVVAEESWPWVVLGYE